MPPLVSAIIPTYNRAALLVRALASVARQDYRPIEAVVVDDGSTDDTPAVAAAQQPILAGKGIELVYHRQANGRAPKARNTGMTLARGSIFAFLDSDDLWFDGYVSTLVGLFDQHPSAGLAFAGIVVIDPDDRVVKLRDTRLPPEPRRGLLPRPFERILHYMPMQTSGVMVRRQVIERLGDFDLDMPVVEDWDLWYRIARHYDFAYTLDGLAANREHPSNLPKYDGTALRSGLRMNLKHLPEVQDPATRDMLVARIRWQLTLLQEQLLREGRSANGDLALLLHHLAPRTLRYRLGAALRHAPSWLGRAYARVVRAAGELHRSARRGEGA